MVDPTVERLTGRKAISFEVRTYCSEPQRGRQRWDGQGREQRAVCANRRRVRGERGKRLLRQRGEKLERWNEHLYDRGGMRRVHLRGRTNILKRLVVQHELHAGLGRCIQRRFLALASISAFIEMQHAAQPGRRPVRLALIRLGAEANLKQPAKPGVAAIEGTEKK